MAKQKEEVKFISIGELPEDLRTKVMNIHKFICDEANSMFNSAKYEYLKKESWANVKLNDFLTMPNPNDRTKVAIYKRGKRCRCMIQVTAHVTNTRDTENEEFFHGFIRNLHMHVRTKVRRKFDLTLTCESEHGEPFEGFDVWTKQKLAAELWEKASDVKTNTVTPLKESAEDVSHIDYIIAEMTEVPYGLRDFIYEVADYFEERSHGNLKYSFRMCANVENGHLLQIKFDLDPASVFMAGDHSNQNSQQTKKLFFLRKNIKKTGSGDFSSIGTVQAITDLDTGKSLQAAETIGIIGSDPKSSRFTVPPKYSDGSGKDFKEYPVAIREKIATELNLKSSGKGITKFVVGQKETKPSYKSTRAYNSVAPLYQNQWSNIKGFHNPTKSDLRHNPYARGNVDAAHNPHMVNFSNMSVAKFIQKMEPKIIQIGDLQNDQSIPNNKRFYIDDVINNFNLLKRRYKRYSGEKFGNVISDPKYSSLIREIVDGISVLTKLTNKKFESVSDSNECDLYDITLRCGMNAMYEGSVYLGTYDRDDPIFEDIEEYAEYIENTFPTKYIDIEESSDGIDVFIKFDPEYAKVLYGYLDR